jgi:putative ABC transport system permease protein
MTPWLIIQSAVSALRVNMMRTILTMLGVVIGVGAVVAMVSAGAGAQQRVADQIQSLGANLIMIKSGAATQTGARLGADSRYTITEDDARAIENEVPGVVAAVPIARGRLQAEQGNLNTATIVLGVTPAYFEARDLDVASGRLFTPDDLESGAKVALLGPTVADELFAGDDPVGRTVRLNKVPFTVIGVLESKGQSNAGVDQDDVVVLPMTTAKTKVLGATSIPGAVYAIAVKAAAPEQMKDVADQTTEVLRQHHRLRPTDADDFRLVNLAEVMKAQEASSSVLTLLLAAIASVSLVVGGIGIMNIMLVSVVERTREIGLRMAIGARGRDVLTQFLLEAVTLSVIGGAIGAILGVAASFVISRIAGWQIVIPAEVILVAVGFSAAVGVFFGFYPARTAARLDPIVALRYE